MKHWLRTAAVLLVSTIAAVTAVDVTLVHLPVHPPHCAR